jgi:hypothetical protein
MSTTCPSCGNASAGRYCSDCGVALNATCRECQNPLPLGARFCNDCGVAIATPHAARSRAAVLPWAVAGVAAAALVGVLVFRPANEPAAQPSAVPAGPFTQGGAPVGDPSSVDLSSMTPREAADRLFNRVLSAEASGDTAQARQFAPMAVQAYGQVQPQDHDVRYHLSELYRVQGDRAAVKAQADAILAASPTHLFGLYAAGRAEVMGGNAAGARAFYKRFLDAYAGEVSRDLPEYRDHQQALPSMRAEAERLSAQ